MHLHEIYFAFRFCVHFKRPNAVHWHIHWTYSFQYPKWFVILTKLIIFNLKPAFVSIWNMVILVDCARKNAFSVLRLHQSHTGYKINEYSCVQNWNNISINKYNSLHNTYTFKEKWFSNLIYLETLLHFTHHQSKFLKYFPNFMICSFYSQLKVDWFMCDFFLRFVALSLSPDQTWNLNWSYKLGTLVNKLIFCLWWPRICDCVRVCVIVVYGCLVHSNLNTLTFWLLVCEDKTWWISNKWKFQFSIDMCRHLLNNYKVKIELKLQKNWSGWRNLTQLRMLLCTESADSKCYVRMKQKSHINRILFDEAAIFMEMSEFSVFVLKWWRMKKNCSRDEWEIFEKSTSGIIRMDLY